jgi:CDP-paratose 2-epimerase
MSVVVITGSAGLIGSEAVEYYCRRGYLVVGIDNDMRQRFFGPGASTQWRRTALERSYPQYQHHDTDIRNCAAIDGIFREFGRDIELVVHAAAQPSHDWAARDPHTDFSINANGTMTLLEATRRFAPDAVFVFASTNKVYGDRPNSLPLTEGEMRWQIDPDHRYRDGIDETMGLDGTTHSLFGVSKTAADLMVQEYGRYFGMKTACFRGGCLTGPNHTGTQLHGFLSYLMRCVLDGTPYTVFGYKAKQVRDNIHSADYVAAVDAFFRAPRVAEVYNIGGGPECSCSMREAIALCEQTAGRRLSWTYSDTNRAGDHIWWVTDTSKFAAHYPGWKRQYNLRATLEQMLEQLVASPAARPR